MENRQKIENFTPRFPPFKVIGTDTDRSANYNFLLVIHNNHGPISCSFQIKAIIPKFFNPRVFNVPVEGCNGVGDQNVE